jgi:hypothetical protein
LFFTVAAVGCGGSVNFDKNVQVEPVEVKQVIVPGPSKELKVRVEIKSPTPVNVYVALEKDAAAVSAKLENTEKPEAGVLARKDKVTDGVVEATIPAKAGFVIMFTQPGPKAVTVQLKVTEAK